MIIGCTSDQDQQADATSLFEQAEAEFQDGKFHLSAMTFTKCIEAARQTGIEVHFSVYGLRGLSNYKIGATQQAMHDTTTALSVIDKKKEPRDVVARLYYQRAIIYRDIKDDKSASADFSNARKYDADGLFDPRHL